MMRLLSSGSFHVKEVMISGTYYIEQEFSFIYAISKKLLDNFHE